MRIAQVSPLFESVPPAGYGGTERVVSWLTEALVERGHHVTLFASGDSRTSAELVPIGERSLRGAQGVSVPLAPHVQMLEAVLRRRHTFDVIHFHCDLIHLPISRRLTTPHVTTVHGRLDLAELVSTYAEYTDVPLVSISEAQRRPVPGCRFVATVHHGMPLDTYTPQWESDHYFAFVGRISPEKRVDRAIEIARALGVPLRIAAKVDRNDLEYFERDIAPLLRDPLVDFVGEVGDEAKAEILGRARALLFPIDWPEPFGLVMIEALACGTPVIAFDHGSVREIVEHGVTGFVVDDLRDALSAAERVGELDRRKCRETFERRFSCDRMAADYLRVYEDLARGTPVRADRLAS